MNDAGNKILGIHGTVISTNGTKNFTPATH